MNISWTFPWTGRGTVSRQDDMSAKSLVVAVVFGGAFAAAGFLFWTLSRVDPTWTRVSGTVVDVAISRSNGSGDSMYAPVVSYVAEGRTYEVTESWRSSSRPDVGDEAEVAYEPGRPGRAAVVPGTFMSVLPWTLVTFGLGFVAFSIRSFTKGRKRSARIRRLVETGERLQGVLIDVHATTTNRTTEYDLVVAATDPTGVVQNYVSDTIVGAAGLLLADYANQPIPIDVYVDRSNPRDYYVDLSDIPNLTPQRIIELVKSALGRAGAGGQAAQPARDRGRGQNGPLLTRRID